jgi:hypothetical protein
MSVDQVCRSADGLLDGDDVVTVDGDVIDC